MPLQELNWCMKELAQLQKEKNDWRCNSWLESATGRSTVLAAQPGKILECVCILACLPFSQFGTLSFCMVRCHAMSQSLKSHKHPVAARARPRQASIYESMSSNAANTQTACYS